jgi:hypothetical protein
LPVIEKDMELSSVARACLHDQTPRSAREFPVDSATEK